MFTWESDYFIASILPTLLGTLFSIPWKLIHHEVVSLEPFHQMTKATGISTTAAAGGPYFAPVVDAPSRHFPIALHSTLESSFVLITALGAESVKLKLVDICEEDEEEQESNPPLEQQKRGCGPVVQVVPKVAWTVMALLVFMAVCGLAMIFLFRRRPSGVFKDPRSVLGIAALIGSGPSSSLEQARKIFGTPRTRTGTGGSSSAYTYTFPLGPKQMANGFRDVTLRLGPRSSRNNTNNNDDENNDDWGLSVDVPPQPEELERQQHQQDSTPSASPGNLRLGSLLPQAVGFIFLHLGVLALIVYYEQTFGDSPFERFMNSQNFGPRLLFASVGIIIAFGWASVMESE